MKRLSQEDFNYKIGSFGLKADQIYLVRNYSKLNAHFTLYCSRHILFDYENMSFKFKLEEKIFKQIGTNSKKAKFINEDSELFKRIKKHMEFLINHYDVKEISRLSEFYHGLPPINPEIYDEFLKIKNEIFEIDKQIHKGYWHDRIEEYEKLKLEKGILRTKAANKYKEGL